MNRHDRFIRFKEAVARYMRIYSMVRHTPDTGTNARRIISGFSEHLEQYFRRRYPLLKEIRQEHVEEYILERRKRRAPATVNGDLTHLKTFFRWCANQEWIDREPTRGIRKLKLVKKIGFRVVTEEQIRRLIDFLESKKKEPEWTYWSAHDPKAKGLQNIIDIILLLANTGLRISEALHLRGEDVDLQGKRLYVRCRTDWKTKNREERQVPLNEEALELCKLLREDAGGPDQLLFRNRAGKPVCRRVLSRRLLKLRRRCGSPVTFHALRHTFATKNAPRYPAQVLMLILGHSSINVTNRYYVHAPLLDIEPPVSVGFDPAAKGNGHAPAVDSPAPTWPPLPPDRIKLRDGAYVFLRGRMWCLETCIKNVQRRQSLQTRDVEEAKRRAESLLSSMTPRPTSMAKEASA